MNGAQQESKVKREMKEFGPSVGAGLIACGCELLSVITHSSSARASARELRDCLAFYFLSPSPPLHPPTPHFVIPLALPSIYSIFTSKARMEQMSFQMSVFCLIA